MKNYLDCLNCLNCKVTPAKLILRCVAGQWLKERDGNERIIKLKPVEAHLIRIEHRDIFLQANKCLLYQ